MTVHLLLVEDDDSAEERLGQELVAAGLSSKIRRALSRDGARTEIEVGNYDLIICDLRIPTSDRGYDASEEHGLSVLDHARAISPGTPVLVLSGYATLKHLSDFLSSGRVEDVFGSGAHFRMAAEASKEDYAKVVEFVRNLEAELAALDEIEVSSGTKALVLSREAKRVLRIFARRQGGLSVEVAPLTGGLSGDTVLRCRVSGEIGTVASVAVRLALISEAEDEVERYRRYISPLLPPGSYAPLADVVDAGAGNQAATYSKLAEEFDRTLFDVLSESDSEAAALVPKLRQTEAPWLEEAANSRENVREVRSALVQDQKHASISAELEGLPWQDFERQTLPVRTACQHGDLHGANVLVDRSGGALIIDYGRVGPATTALDPVTLELSALFHPSAANFRGEWPTENQAAQWDALPAYLEGCPYPAFVRASRDWAFDVAGDRAVYATVYAYAVRQLTYEGTDHQLAQALVAGAIRAFQEH